MDTQVARVPISRKLIREAIMRNKLIAYELVQHSSFFCREERRMKLSICKKPGRCAVGALLAAVGKSDEDLWAMPSSPHSFENADLLLLYETYGLNREGLLRLLTANDDSHGSKRRRKRDVLRTVDQLEDGAFQSNSWEWDDSSSPTDEAC